MRLRMRHPRQCTQPSQLACLRCHRGETFSQAVRRKRGIHYYGCCCWWGWLYSKKHRCRCANLSHSQQGRNYKKYRKLLRKGLMNYSHLQQCAYAAWRHALVASEPCPDLTKDPYQRTRLSPRHNLTQVSPWSPLPVSCRTSLSLPYLSNVLWPIPCAAFWLGKGSHWHSFSSLTTCASTSENTTGAIAGAFTGAFADAIGTGGGNTGTDDSDMITLRTLQKKGGHEAYARVESPATEIGAPGCNVLRPMLIGLAPLPDGRLGLGLGRVI